MTSEAPVRPELCRCSQRLGSPLRSACFPLAKQQRAAARRAGLLVLLLLLLEAQNNHKTRGNWAWTRWESFCRRIQGRWFRQGVRSPCFLRSAWKPSLRQTQQQQQQQFAQPHTGSDVREQREGPLLSNTKSALRDSILPKAAGNKIIDTTE